jgi:hypothetical protein
MIGVGCRIPVRIVVNVIAVNVDIREGLARHRPSEGDPVVNIINRVVIDRDVGTGVEIPQQAPAHIVHRIVVNRPPGLDPIVVGAIHRTVADYGVRRRSVDVEVLNGEVLQGEVGRAARGDRLARLLIAAGPAGQLAPAVPFSVFSMIPFVPPSTVI